MKENEKKQYLERYQKAKDEGESFYPFILFKDAIASLIVFLILLALAYFVGAPLESRANPADTSYTPHPEWYFLFLFQLLKYFPGKLEVLGVIIIPGIVITLLFLLPLLDKGPKRHFMNRPWVTGITSIIVIGIVTLTVLSYLEAPPPFEEIKGDPVAALYTENCASCHGPSIAVPEVMDLHTIIAQGTHEGMPAWSGDLSTDEIDSLAGFITSPGGNDLFKEYCLECHQISDLVASNPIDLNNAIDQGNEYQPHAELEIPIWKQVLTSGETTELLNFLAAPDGQRLFVINCASCHGTTVGYTGGEVELREIISQGGLHLEMPSWRETLSSVELDQLTEYVTDPAANPESIDLFDQNCASCHGSRIPDVMTFEQTRQTIASGGAHETMPLWGDVLTNAQLEALTIYTWETSQGTSLEIGQSLYAENCAFCHGTFGEGGQNPARADDIIAPISSLEYLNVRDNTTLYNIIAQGQPNFGMSPFGSEYGGPLSEEQIDSIISFMRSWEANPPVELPPEVQPLQDVNLSGQEIYDTICTQCHRPDGTANAPLLSDNDFQENTSDQDIFDSIKNGHLATPMIAFSGLLTDDQIQELIEIIRQLEPELSESSITPSGPPSFSADILPILETECNVCHGSLGGWDGSTYDSVINSGDNGPAVIPGDIENSLLALKLLDTQETGTFMPPAGILADDLIQIFLNWIKAGAPDN